MGSKSITDKLDQEIKALEEAQGLSRDAEGAPAVSVAADPSASFNIVDNPTDPPAATGTDPEAVTMPTATPEPEQLPEDEPNKQKRISWKNRYTKLKSHHDASRFKDRNTISDAFARITILERENITLRTDVEALRTAKPISVADLATPEELNVIGDEGISSIDRITKRAVDSAVGPLKEQLARQEKDRVAQVARQAHTAGQQAYDSFLERLSRAVPNFAAIDEEPEFEKYLSDPDPESGVRRMEHFKKAEAIGDVGRVASYFRDYESKKMPTGQQRMAAQVTPVGHGGAPPVPPPPGEVEVYRASDYRKFMTDVTKGRKYKGRQAEADAIEAKFDQAFIEGRIIPD